MRRSRSETAATRAAIVVNASRLFRSNGIAAVSVADIMGSLGLTVGGFYRHFGSKDALVAEAITFASEETTRALSGARDRARPGMSLRAVLEFYLSRTHRKNRGHGCPVAAFAGEVPHCSEIVKRAFAEAHGRLATVIASARGVDTGAADGDASLSVATIVGGLLMGRAIKDDASTAALDERLISTLLQTPAERIEVQAKAAKKR